MPVCPPLPGQMYSSRTCFGDTPFPLTRYGADQHRPATTPPRPSVSRKTLCCCAMRLRCRSARRRTDSPKFDNSRMRAMVNDVRPSTRRSGGYDFLQVDAENIDSSTMSLRRRCEVAATVFEVGQRIVVHPVVGTDDIQYQAG